MKRWAVNKYLTDGIIPEMLKFQDQNFGLDLGLKDLIFLSISVSGIGLVRLV